MPRRTARPRSGCTSIAVERTVLPVTTARPLLLVEAEAGELLAQRVAIEPEQLRRLDLIAAGVREHEVEQRALDALEDFVVEVVDRIAVDPSDLYRQLCSG